MFGYPKELCYKVFERQGRCLEKLGHSIDAVDSLEESIKRLDVSKLEGKKKETYAEDLRKRLDTIKKTGTKKARKWKPFSHKKTIPSLKCIPKVSKMYMATTRYKKFQLNLDT